MFRGTALEEALNERVSIGTNDTAISTLIRLANRERAGELRVVNDEAAGVYEATVGGREAGGSVGA